MRSVRIPSWLREFHFHSERDEDVRPASKSGDAGFYDTHHPLQDQAGPVSARDLVRLFEAWLLLNHGSGYRLIKDPAQFRGRAEQAVRRMRAAGRAAHGKPHAGQYNLAEMHEPKLRDGKLLCYVEDRVSGIPYRVELPWPIDPHETARFRLLPQLHENDDDLI